MNPNQTISQRNIQTRRPQGHVGQLVTSSRLNKCTTLINNAPQAAQVSDVVVANAVANADHAFKVNGIEIKDNSGVGATNQSTAEKLIAKVNANPLVRGQVRAELIGVNTVRLTSTYPGMAFTLTEDDANLTVTAITSPALADAIPFGRLLISTGYMDAIGPQEGKEFNELCALPKSTTLKKRAVVLMPTAANAGIYHLILEVDGKIYDCSVTGDADATEQEIVEAQAAKVNAAMPANTVIATEDDAALTLTAEVAGKTFKYTAWAEGAGAAVDVTSDDNPPEADLNKVAAGISVRRYDQATRSIPGGSAEYQPNEGVEALEDGSIWAENEEAPTRGDVVYVETDPTKDVGGFYKSASATRIPLKDAAWQRAGRGDVPIAALRFRRAI